MSRTTKTSRRRLRSFPHVTVDMSGFHINVFTNTPALTEAGHITEGVNGQLSTRRIRTPLLEGFEIGPGFVSYYRWLEANGLVTMERKGNCCVRGDLASKPDCISNHSAAIHSLMAEVPLGLVVRHEPLRTEHIALSIARAFPQNRILYLAQSDHLSQSTYSYLLQNQLRAYLLDGRSSETFESIPHGVKLVLSTIERAHDIHPFFDIVVVLDRKVLNADYFHMLFTRTHDPVPRLLGVLSADEAFYKERFLKVCQVFGFRHLHLHSDDRMARRVESLRIPFSHGMSTEESNPRKTVMKQVIGNYKRNRFIARCAKGLLPNGVLKEPECRKLRNWKQNMQISGVAIVVDELLHAVKLLFELKSWKFITKLSREDIEVCGLRQRQRELLINSLSCEDDRAVIVMADAIHKLKEDITDVLMLASSSSELPLLPRKLLRTNTNKTLTLIDINDSGVKSLAENALARALGLRKNMVYPVGTEPAEANFQKFHSLALSTSRAR